MLKIIKTEDEPVKEAPENGRDARMDADEEEKSPKENKRDSKKHKKAKKVDSDEEGRY